ncbi:DUF6233 domain-containing protein [Streptomyces sp. NPDC057927]
MGYLETAIADNETVHVYLDLQRGHVLDALKVMEGGTLHRAPAVPAPASEPRQERPSSGFKIGRVRTPDGAIPASVHTDDCGMSGPLTKAVSAMDARVAIVDGQLEVCAYCRPDTALGVDFD